MRKSHVYEFVLTAMFSVIITICAWITIPFAVPFTMQTFGVFLTISVLGGKLATMSIASYILLGAVGIPVFSGFQSGMGVLFGNTGGYVIGFLVAALLVWGIEYVTKYFIRKNKSNRTIGNPCSELCKGRFVKKKTWVLAVQLFTGLLVCYASGTAWFWILYMKNAGAISLGAVLGISVVPFVVPDVVKILLVLAVQKRLRRMIKFGMR